MERIPVSTFKATCSARMERVRQTRQPLLITKRGIPIAQVLPPPVETLKASAFWSMAGRAVEIGDIVAPLDEEEREVLR